MFRTIYKKLREMSGSYSMQTLMDRGYIKMTKTKEYEADDYDNKISFWYRLTFDNNARKRRFLSALEKYPEQEWDAWVKWFNDFSSYNGEICAEAKCLVPPDKLGRFKHKFEQFVTKDLVLKD